jgi:hypothetical protein
MITGLNSQGVPVVHWGPSDRNDYVQIDVEVRAPSTQAMRNKVPATFEGYPIVVNETNQQITFDVKKLTSGAARATHDIGVMSFR